MFSERKFSSRLSLLLGLCRLLLVLDGGLGVPLVDGARHGAARHGVARVPGLEGGLHLAQHPGVHTRRRQQGRVVQSRA